MVYYLYHKNIEVLSVEYDSDTHRFGKIIHIKNENHIPVGLLNIPNMTLSQSLTLWWQTRLIPENRKINIESKIFLNKLIEENYGFNLSDQYWIKKENSYMTWEKGNFFSNNFSEDIGKYIIGESNSTLENVKSNSPDLFSNGEQDKRWTIDRNKRVLIKYGQPPYYEQPFNEILTTEICRRLNINCVKYGFFVKGSLNPTIYSTCQCFINGNNEFVPAGFIQYVIPIVKGESEYNHLLRCCKALGMNNIQQIENDLCYMMLVDYILGNTDRHFGNFGFIRNVTTLEWTGLAPIFDTGNSMFYEYPTSDLRKSTSLMDNVISKTFASTQKKQLSKFANKIAMLNIDFSKLDDIDIYYLNISSRNPKSDKERGELLSKLLKKRIMNAQTIIYGKNDTTEEFLSLIKNNKENIALSLKIANAVKIISERNSVEKNIISSFLRSLEAKSPKDLEDKIKKILN